MRQDLFDYLVYVGALTVIGVVLLGTMAGCVHYTGMSEDELYGTVQHVRQ